jgi:threonine dehydrogenase-like Zn-dependent dehydrogenase
MQCFYCRNGYSSRCTESQLFGSGSLDGGQAEYVRVPLADGTAIKAPSTISSKALLLLADIWPTGYFGAKSGFGMMTAAERETATAVVIGCGPVGLCAVVAALEYKPKRLFAIDSIGSRLEIARQLGAEPLNFLETDATTMVQLIRDASDGRGADVVIEVVGLSPALRTAFDLVRPWGVISSIGVHNDEVRPCPPPLRPLIVPAVPAVLVTVC